MQRWTQRLGIQSQTGGVQQERSADGYEMRAFAHKLNLAVSDGFLNDVLRIGLGPCLLPGKQQELRRVVIQPPPPIGLCQRIMH